MRKQSCAIFAKAHNLHIGDRNAEDIKINIGTTLPGVDKTMQVRVEIWFRASTGDDCSFVQ